MNPPGGGAERLRRRVLFFVEPQSPEASVDAASPPVAPSVIMPASLGAGRQMPIPFRDRHTSPAGHMGLFGSHSS